MNLQRYFDKKNQMDCDFKAEAILSNIDELKEQVEWLLKNKIPFPHYRMIFRCGEDLTEITIDHHYENGFAIQAEGGEKIAIDSFSENWLDQFNELFKEYV